MNSPAAALSPSITSMIRMDHQHVLMSFHRFKPDMSASTKQGLVNTVLLALEIHAQLEEEIFYPAVQAVASDASILDKSVPEHDEMRALIAVLRDKPPQDADFDATFFELIRKVMHHVADEETVLLPFAEVALADQLKDLGAQMTRRRLQLLAPHLGELTVNTVKAMSPAKMLMVGAGVLLGGYAAKRALERRQPPSGIDMQRVPAQAMQVRFLPVRLAS
ncbi:MAG: hemerythrin domain-containing protein [Aquabacterium sp.]